MTFASDRAAMETRINETLADADVYLDKLAKAADQNFGVVPYSVDTILGNSFWFYSPDPPSTSVSLPDPPPDLEVTIDPGEAPSDPEITFLPIEPVNPPSFEIESPDLAEIQVPSANLPPEPSGAPSFEPLDKPSKPQIDLPTLPTFEDLLLPTPPSISLPSFTGALPTDDLIAPTAQFEFYEAAYESTLLDPLKAKLLADLTDGGYGIETADEVALFNRARDREIEAMLSRIEDAGRAMAMRGFPLPPGELSIHVDRAYQDMQDKVSSVSRDITLERSKLFVENRQFTIREVKDVEQILIGFHNSVQERALNIAKATVELSIALFKSLVERFVARLESYKAEAEVFTNRIRGELAKAEIYRTQVDASRLGVQIQQARIERYIAQIKGIEALVNIFRIEMDAAAISAGIERTKLEAFRLRVDTFSAQVQAKTAEFGLYRAQIEGQKARVDIFDAQARAYNSEIAGLKAKTDASLATIQNETEQARTKIAEFQREIAKYETVARVNIAKAQGEVSVYQGQMEGYRAEVDARTREAELGVGAYKATIEADKNTAHSQIETARVKLDAAIASTKLKMESTKFGSEKFFALLTSMTQTVNSLSVETVAE